MRRWKNRPEGSNWGDFGDDDQRGRVNLITPEIRKAAAREIREGIAFCLSLPLDYPGGNELFKTRRAPRLFSVKRENDQTNFNFQWRTMTCNHNHLDVTCDDAVTLFTQYSTQWDALAHYGQLFDADGDGEPEMVYYNGYRAGEHIVGPAQDGEGQGAKALGIENLAEAAVQGRGTMVNLHAQYGLEHIPVGYDAFMRVIEEQRVEVAKGDILCIYTGFDELLLGMNKQPDAKKLHSNCTGLDGGDAKLQRWIDDSGIVAIAADNTAVEFLPAARTAPGPRPLMPLHAHCIFKLGMHLGELWYLKDLAAWLQANERTSFFLTAPPLRLPGSVGSPLTPIATV